MNNYEQKYNDLFETTHYIIKENKLFWKPCFLKMFNSFTTL